MKQLVLSSIMVALLSSCLDIEPAKIATVQVERHPTWASEDFKDGYTIQFPDTYEGDGMTGFEGNTFSKNRSDDKVLFAYNYCTETFCYDYGQAIEKKSIPPFIFFVNDDDEMLRLDNLLGFAIGDEVVGLFYFNNASLATGIYFMRQGDKFREAVEVSFDIVAYPEVEKIIKSIEDVD